MKKSIFAALCAIAFAACGGGDKKDPISAGPDAAPRADATPTEVCNPVTQEGCADGEKCTQVVEQVDDPNTPADEFFARIQCVANGTVAIDGECASGEPGPEGYDNCEKGAYCINGVCNPICSISPDSCRGEPDPGFGEGGFCTPYHNLFNERNDPPPPTTGACSPACHPNEPEDCEEGKACTLSRERSTCAFIPEQAKSRTQNSVCFGPTPTDCFSNGCAAGFTSIIPQNPGVQTDASALCSRYCTPVDTNLASPDMAEGANGNCSLDSLTQLGGTNQNLNPHQCRFRQSWGQPNSQSPPLNIPADVGFCVPTIHSNGEDMLGDCTLLDIEGMRKAWNDAVAAGGDNAAANDAVDEFCYEPVKPEAPEGEMKLRPECRGFFFGCMSLKAQQEGFDEPKAPGAPPASFTPRSGKRKIGPRLNPQVKLPDYAVQASELY